MKRNIIRSNIICIFLYFLCCAKKNDIDSSALAITEIMASNGCAVVNRITGEYNDWFEVKNTSSTTISLGDYFASDNGVDMYRMPKVDIEPNCFAVIWCTGESSNNSLPFKLSSMGETVFIYNLDSVLVDSVCYNPIPQNVSIERVGEKWMFSEPASPGRESWGYSSEQFVRSSQTLYSREGGLLRSPARLELSSANGDPIFYTLDGTIPTPDCQRYDAPINIDSTVTVSARTFRKGSIGGNVTTHTYLYNPIGSLPILSITTADEYLWDDSIGIYCIGKNGINWFSITANYNRGWVRPVSYQLFDRENNKTLTEGSGGLSVIGFRRKMPQKTMKLVSRSKYGCDNFNYRFFPERKELGSRDIVIRNTGYPDYKSSLIRSGFLHNLIGKNTALDYAAYKAISLYMNGEYWGLYSIRERINSDLIKRRYGVDSIDIIEFKADWIVKDGDEHDYAKLQHDLETMDMSSDSAIEYFRNHFDLSNLLDYYISQTFIGNADWPGNNQILWKEKGSEGRWRWILDDVDVACGLWGGAEVNIFDIALAENSTSWQNRPPSTLVFRKFLENEEMKKLFIQRYCVLIDVLFTPQKALPLLDSLVATIEAEVPLHITRWTKEEYKNTDEYADGTVVSSIEKWKSELEGIRDFFNKRSSFVRKQLSERFQLSGTKDITIKIIPESSGGVQVAGYSCGVGSQKMSLFSNMNVEIKAIPAPGYELKDINGLEHHLSIDYPVRTEDTIVVTFTKKKETVFRDTIKQDMVLSQTGSPYLFSGEVIVDSGVTLTIMEGVVCLFDEKSSLVVHGDLWATGNEKTPIQFLPLHSDRMWGGLGFATNSKAKLRWCEINGSTSVLSYDDPGTLCALNAELSLEKVNVTSQEQPVFVRGGIFYAKGCTFYSPSTCDFINVKFGETVIEECTFNGNSARDTDAIDYDGVKNGQIKRCIFSNFNGPNSDAIDLGEECDSILVSHNQISNCSDKGISVGQSSSALIVANIISNCAMGIGVKDDKSNASVQNCTFDSNAVALAVFEKNLWAGGGRITAKNSLFSRSVNADYYSDNSSAIGFTFSISDKSYLPGCFNRNCNPGIRYSYPKKYAPEKDSPCLNSGDPTTPKDKDGSAADIGAYHLIFGYNDAEERGQLVTPPFSVYVKPGSNELMLYLKDTKKVHAVLYNVRGQILSERTLTPINQSPLSLFSLNNFATGYYLLQLTQGATSSVIPFVY